MVYHFGINLCSPVCAAQQIVGSELLILAQIESDLGHNHLDDWGYLCQPAIATTQAL